MAEIKRAFKTFNGSGWDTCYFDTDESQIKMGFQQSLACDYVGKWAYKKLPGGLAIAWCHMDWTKFSSHSASGGVKCVVNYPFTFQSGCIAFATPVYSAGLPSVAVSEIKTTNCGVVTSNASGIAVDFFVIGEVA